MLNERNYLAFLRRSNLICFNLWILLDLTKFGPYTWYQSLSLKSGPEGQAPAPTPAPPNLQAIPKNKYQTHESKGTCSINFPFEKPANNIKFKL
jgi:hypothetical protein